MTRSDRAWLIAIAAAATIPRLWLATRHGIEYDGYWHLFIARQDHWPTFQAELFRNAHPPLYFLLLKLIIPFSRSLVAYRSISMAAGVLSIYAFGVIAFRVMERRAMAFLATAAFGFAISSVWLSIEIRSYTAATLMFLVAVGALIRRASTEEQRARNRFVFAVSASFAILFHYGMLFPIAATVAVTAAISLRRLKRTPKTVWLDGAAAAVPFLVFGIVYFLHARNWARPLSHLPEFYLSSSGTHAGAFLMAGLGALSGMFSPIDPGVLAAPLAVIVAMLAIVAAIAEWRDGRTATAMMHWTLIVLLVALAAAGILGLYPFGGELRQQYLLFPFLVLSVFAMFDRVLRRLPGDKARAALAITIAFAVAMSAVSQLRAFRVNPRRQFEPAFERLVARVPEAAPGPGRSRSALWVDQFSLIVVFSRHHAARWRYLGVPAGDPDVTAYRVEHAGGNLLLLRDRSRWTLHLGEGELYRDIAVNARALGISNIVIASIDQTLQRELDRQTLRWIDERSRAADLLPERVDSEGACVLAVFGVPANDRVR